VAGPGDSPRCHQDLRLSPCRYSRGHATER